MNKGQLLNVLLFFVVIWVTVGTLYFLFILSIKLSEKYHRYLRSRREQKKGAGEVATQTKGEEEYQLVGKSKSYSPPISKEFPTVPSTSSSEKAVENIDTFASELPEQSGNSVAISEEEENELQIDYSDDMEEVDIEQNEREALLIFDESSATEPPHSGGVLVKELARLQQASQKEKLNEEETKAVRETITELQGTDLMEQYNKNNAHFELEGKAIMKVIREVETKGGDTESQSTSTVEQTSAPSEEPEGRPLSYYL